MSTRERRLLFLLGVLGAFGLAAGAYVLILSPIRAARAEYRKLMDEEAKAEFRVPIGKDAGKEVSRDEYLAALQASLPRLKEVKRRSLPANPDVARREYEAALGRLAAAAKVPGCTISARSDTDTRGIPLLEPKKPAYSRVGFQITMKKVDLPTLTKFLRSYYDLGVLHQITQFDIKRTDEAAAAAKKGAAERNDLDVQIVTEAVILDGAEQRQTLVSVPKESTVAVGGGVGYHLILNSPKLSSALPPPRAVGALASIGRDYALLAAKDVFHGPLPKPDVKPVVERPKEAVVEKPKPPIDQFVKLTDITRRSDGSAEAHIRDVANNRDYQLDVKVRDGKPATKVQKFQGVVGKWIRMERWDDAITIAEEDSTTNRTFKVVGLIDNGLVLTETASVGAKPEEKKEEKKDDRRRTGGRPGGDRSKTPVGVAVGSGLVAVHPAADKPAATEERVYHWQAGQTMEMLKHLTPAEGRDLVRRASADPAAAVKVTKAD